MAPVEVLWWGFSPEHGWVVYDRSIKFNEQQHAILLLLKCSDGTIIAEERKRWNRPHYIFAPRYIDSLPLNERKAKLAELEGLQSKWSHQKTAEIGFQFIREQLFKTLGKIAPGTRPAINRHHRQTHCYNCKSALDSSIDVECIECRWLVCDCGACGCGYLPA